MGLCYKFSLLIILVIGYLNAAPQVKRGSFDSSYYKTYPKMVTGRVFFSKKYTSPVLEGKGDAKNLRYRPNNFLSAGVGATYGIATLNLGFNLGFLNPDKTERGKTKFLDLQSHIYPKKWLIDLYGQFYSGYYLGPRGFAAKDPNSFYTRRDLSVNLIGASVYRLLNDKKFSYRASFLQNEWQQKSAGSFLYGVEIYSGHFKGDSSLVPSTLSDQYSQAAIRKINFTEFGPGAGYAYTLVWKKNFFATGSVTVNADMSFVKEFSTFASDSRISVTPNVSFRAVLGYNSDKWIGTLSWINSNTNLRGTSSNDEYFIKTGNVRLTLAKRFKPGRLLKRRLKVIDQIPVTE